MWLTAAKIRPTQRWATVGDVDQIDKTKAFRYLSIRRALAKINCVIRSPLVVNCVVVVSFEKEGETGG